MEATCYSNIIILCCILAGVLSIPVAQNNATSSPTSGQSTLKTSNKSLDSNETSDEYLPYIISQGEIDLVIFTIPANFNVTKGNNSTSPGNKTTQAKRLYKRALDYYEDNHEYDELDDGAGKDDFPVVFDSKKLVHVQKRSNELGHGTTESPTTPKEDKSTASSTENSESDRSINVLPFQIDKRSPQQLGAPSPGARTNTTSHSIETTSSEESKSSEEKQIRSMKGHVQSQQTGLVTPSQFETKSSPTNTGTTDHLLLHSLIRRSINQTEGTAPCTTLKCTKSSPAIILSPPEVVNPPTNISSSEPNPLSNQTPNQTFTL